MTCPKCGATYISLACPNCLIEKTRADDDARAISWIPDILKGKRALILFALPTGSTLRGMRRDHFAFFHTSTQTICGADIRRNWTHRAWFYSERVPGESICLVCREVLQRMIDRAQRVA